MSSGKITPSGILFTVSKSGKNYLCMHKHRGHGSPLHKTCWNIPEIEEFNIFCDSDNYSWNDSKGDYWGVKKDGSSIGNGDERVAKFPKPVNPIDPWHGYPVMTGRKNDKPSLKIIDNWLKIKYIDRILARRIKLGKV